MGGSRMERMEVVPVTTGGLQPQVNNVSGATSDTHLITLWLTQKGRRSKNTLRVYEYEVDRFFDVVGKPLRAVTVTDMQGYIKHLEDLGLAPATQARALSTIRSLFAFAQKTGYIQFNVTQAVECQGPSDYRIQLHNTEGSPGTA